MTELSRLTPTLQTVAFQCYLLISVLLLLLSEILQIISSLYFSYKPSENVLTLLAINTKTYMCKLEDQNLISTKFIIHYLNYWGMMGSINTEIIHYLFIKNTNIVPCLAPIYG